MQALKATPIRVLLCPRFFLAFSSEVCFPRSRRICLVRQGIGQFENLDRFKFSSVILGTDRVILRGLEANDVFAKELGESRGDISEMVARLCRRSGMVCRGPFEK